MSSEIQIIQTTRFVEFVAVPVELSTNIELDIIIENEITLYNYCKAVVNKVLNLQQSQFLEFINYQCDKVNDSSVWLNTLEKLVCINEEYFTSKCALIKIGKLINLIELKQRELQSSRVKTVIKRTPKRLINANSDERHFSFYEVKNHIESLPIFYEKIIYLTEEIFAYKQAAKFSINTTLQEYDVQCSQLIEHLQTIRKMRADCEMEKQNYNPNQTYFKKIQFNGNLNQLVDVFYQLQRELFIDGKSYIDGNTNDLIALIVNTFIDKDGNEISPQTVETILKPSRTDKRPKPHKRLDIDKIL